MLGRKRNEREENANFYIRQRIKTARAERGVSQQELASRMHKSRVSISDIERGRVQVSSADLAAVAAILEKPVAYFYPPTVRGADAGDLSPQEQELIHFFRQLWQDALRIIALSQMKALAEAAIEADRTAKRQGIQDRRLDRAR